MSDSFLSLYEREEGTPREEGPLPILPARQDIFQALKVYPAFDLIVIGGGLSGVTLAREAALRGSEVLLVEPGYFGERSSLWREVVASKITRDSWTLIRTLGGLKNVTSVIAPHLSAPFAWQPEAPLSFLGKLAMWMIQRKWGDGRGGDSSSVLPDVDERLLTRETALAARQEGAFLLSATTAAYVERDSDIGGFRVGVKDLLSEETYSVKGRTLYIDRTFSGPVASRIGTPITRRAIRRPFGKRVGVFHRGGLLMSDERVPWDIYSLTSKILSRVPSCAPARRVRRPLPGEWRGKEREEFISLARAAGVSDATIEQVIKRWRGRVRYIPLLENGLHEERPGVLKGEIELANMSDQVASNEDLTFGAVLEGRAMTARKDCLY